MSRRFGSPISKRSDVRGTPGKKQRRPVDLAARQVRRLMESRTDEVVMNPDLMEPSTGAMRQMTRDQDPVPSDSSANPTPLDEVQEVKIEEMDRADSDGLGERVRQLEAQLQTAKDTIQELTEEYEELSKKNTETSQEVARLQEEKAEISEDYNRVSEELDKEKAEHKKTVDEAEATVAISEEHEATIKEMDAQLQDAATKRVELEVALQQSEAAREQLEAKLQDMDANVVEQKAEELRELQDENSTLKRALKLAKTAVEAQKKEKEKAREDGKGAWDKEKTEMVAKHKGEIKALKEEHAKKIKKINAEHREELGKIKKEKRGLEKELQTFGKNPFERRLTQSRHKMYEEAVGKQKKTIQASELAMKRHNAQLTSLLRKLNHAARERLGPEELRRTLEEHSKNIDKEDKDVRKVLKQAANVAKTNSQPDDLRKMEEEAEKSPAALLAYLEKLALDGKNVSDRGEWRSSRWRSDDVYVCVCFRLRRVAWFLDAMPSSRHVYITHAVWWPVWPERVPGPGLGSRDRPRMQTRRSMARPRCRHRMYRIRPCQQQSPALSMPRKRMTTRGWSMLRMPSRVLFESQQSGPQTMRKSVWMPSRPSSRTRTSLVWTWSFAWPSCSANGPWSLSDVIVSSSSGPGIA